MAKWLLPDRIEINVVVFLFFYLLVYLLAYLACCFLTQPTGMDLRTEKVALLATRGVWVRPLHTPATSSHVPTHTWESQTSSSGPILVWQSSPTCLTGHTMSLWMQSTMLSMGAHSSPLYSIVHLTLWTLKLLKWWTGMWLAITRQPISWLFHSTSGS